MFIQQIFIEHPLCASTILDAKDTTVNQIEQHKQVPTQQNKQNPQTKMSPPYGASILEGEAIKNINKQNRQYDGQ